MRRKPRKRPETAPAFAFRSDGVSGAAPAPENALATLLAIRAEAESLTEKLIAFLDAVDGDTDREPEDEHDEDGGDLEPNLGTLEQHPSAPGYGLYSSPGTWPDGDQTNSAGLPTDLELDLSDFEPDCDAEPLCCNIRGGNDDHH